MADYELYYWPGIQGRGEFVRLALEEAGASYIDVARGPRGEDAIVELLDGQGVVRAPFAPPFLRHGELVVGQTAVILLYLGPRLGLAPADEAGRLWCHQIQLTIADVVAEAHDTHHPIAAGLYYEEQKIEAARRARDFRTNRIPAFLAWFEAILSRNPDSHQHLISDSITYADLSLFQLMAGLAYAFPRAMRRESLAVPRVAALAAAVAARPRIRAYLESRRRLPFSDAGIFRHYPELDG